MNKNKLPARRLGIMEQTPEEKAKELINMFYQPVTIHISCAAATMSSKKLWEYAKICAASCIDQIIKAEPTRYSAWERVSTEDYWQQVKKELLKL